MNWLIWMGLAALLAGCFMAGTLPGDRWLDLVLGLRRVRFSASPLEFLLNVIGVIANVVCQILAGAFRLLTFVLGSMMILSDRAGEKLGSAFPAYPKKEIEEKEK